MERASTYFLGSAELQELVYKNQDSHFFLDEVHLAQNQISSKVLAELSEKVSPDNFFWVASQGDRPPTKTDPNFKGNKYS